MEKDLTEEFIEIKIADSIGGDFKTHDGHYYAVEVLQKAINDYIEKNGDTMKVPKNLFNEYIHPSKFRSTK